MNVLFVFALLLATVASAPSVIPPDHYPPEVRSLMDLTADPCNDFYQYACGTWLANATIPPSVSAYYRTFTMIEENNQEILKAIIEASLKARDSPTYPKIGDFYRQCMDTTTINAQGTTAIDEWINSLQSVGSWADVFASVATMHAAQVPAFVQLGVVTDAKNPNNVIAEFDQGGFALPDQTMYANFTPSSPPPLLADYVEHVSTMFKLYGDQDYKRRGVDVVTLEACIAAANLAPDQIRDPESVYHIYSMNDFYTAFPEMPWPTYFNTLYGNFTVINVAEPAFVRGLQGCLFAAVPSGDFTPVQSYLMWQVLHATAGYLPDAFANETFRFFGTELTGAKQMPPRFQQCIQQTDASLGDIVGRAFADAAFSGQSMQVITTMVGQIVGAFQNVLNTVQWMDPVTRSAGLQKLSLVTRRIGYPANPSNYSDYDMQPNSFLVNLLTKQSYDFTNSLARLGMPPDRNRWEMTADTVNAYYEPTDNSINFPAGIMQTPYFSAARSLAENFAGIGVIMGHELTHGFDDQGRMYDGYGKLQNWWQNSTLEKFLEETQCMSAQYSSFQVIPGVFVNGNLTLGENIADNGGVHNAFAAYKALAGADTDPATFFVSYAQGWCAKLTDEYVRVMVATNPHSPPKFRSIGPLMNNDDFAAAFTCPQGSVMNPVTKCKVW